MIFDSELCMCLSVFSAEYTELKQQKKERSCEEDEAAHGYR